MRCPECHRRLRDGQSCPAHPEARTPPAAERPPPPLPPAIPGLGELTLLGMGGFGAVFGGVRDGGARVAVKLALRPGDPRFHREANMLRRVGAPLSPAFMGEGKLDGRPYLLMEQLDGVSLDREMLEPRSTDERLQLLARVGAAVDALHALGVVHRDLKPENVFLCGPERVALIDYGLARDLRGGGDDDTEDEGGGVTQTGERLGTALYMAPEQALGRRLVDPRTDLYALAVIGWELLAGRPPFSGDPAQIIHAHVATRPPRLSEAAGLPAAVDEVMNRALAKEPASRFDSAAVWLRELSRAVASGTKAAGAGATGAGAGAGAAEATKRARLVPLLAVRHSGAVRRVLDAAGAEAQLVRTLEQVLVLAFPDAPPGVEGLREALRAAERCAELAEGCVLHAAELRVRPGPRGALLMGAAVAPAANWWQPLDGPAPASDRVLLSADAARLLDPTGVGEAELFVTARPSAVREQVSPPPAPLCGRDQLLARVTRMSQAALEGDAPVLVTIVGDAGHGKSRVLAALTERLGAATGQTPVELRARPPEEADAETLLRELLARLLGLADGAGVEAVRAAVAALPGADAEAWPAVALALGLLRAGAPEVGRLAVAPGALRQAQAGVLAAAMAARAAPGQPFLLALDDAQWADHASLDALELATMAERAAPIAVLVAVRPGFEQLRVGWGSRAETAQRHELAPLDAQAARALLMAQLSPVEYVADSVVARMIELTGGVPGALVELAMALRRAGAVRPLRGTRSWFLAADDLLSVSATPLAERLAARALAGLSPALVELLRLAALCGREVTAAELDAVLARLESPSRQAAAAAAAGDLDAGVALGRLARAGILRPLGGPAGAAGYAFRQPLLRDVLVAGLTGAERRAMHDAIRAHLLERGDDELITRVRIARHTAGAGDAPGAAARLLGLADEVAAQHRYVEAEQLYGDALALGVDEGTLRERAFAGRGRARYRLRRMSDAAADLEAAEALARGRGDRAAEAWLLLERATLLDWFDDFAGAAALVERAAPLAEAAGDELLAARARLGQGRSAYRAERLAQAIELTGDALARCQRLGDYEGEVIARLILGPALTWAGELERAEACFEEARRLADGAGDRLHLSVVHGNRIVLWMKRLEPEKALADAEQAMALAREVGHASMERVARYNLAELLLWLGRGGEAQAHAERSLELQERFYAEPVAEDRLLLARLAVACGRAAEAAPLCGWIREHVDASHVAPSQRLLLALCELAAAPGAFAPEPWRELTARAADEALGDERLEILHQAAQAAAAAGDRASCDAFLAEAAALPMAPAWSRRFAAIRAA